MATASLADDVFSARIAGAALFDTAWNETPGLYSSVKYPLMSISRWPGALTKTLIEPFVPAGTTAALATSCPALKLSVDTTGCAPPVGHAVRNAFWNDPRRRDQREVQGVGLRTGGNARAVRGGVDVERPCRGVPDERRRTVGPR